MRLAVTGASNCGKTTLAKDLAKTLKLQVIPEFLGSPFEVSPHLTPLQEMKRFAAILEAKSHREATLSNGFVSDRCPIDLAYSWLIRGLPLRYPKESQDFISLCKKQSPHYDALVFPPGPSPELGSVNYFGKPARIWEMWRNHNALIGLAFQWLPTNKVHVIPTHVETREQRIEWVLENCITK